MTWASLLLTLVLALSGCRGDGGRRLDASGDQACRAVACVCQCGAGSAIPGGADDSRGAPRP